VADRPLPNYPQPFGTRQLWIGDHQGPANYQTGGETLNASALGWSSFDSVRGGMTFNSSNNGFYTMRVYYPSAQSPALSNNSIVGNLPSGSNNVTLVWVVSSNSAEVAANSNLAGEFCRVEFYGG
jgi:hypothetical protein